MDQYEEKRIRKGKTLKDRQSGATARRYDNQRARTDWIQDSNATNSSFPRETCNGRRNRSIVVNKKNGRIAKRTHH